MDQKEKSISKIQKLRAAGFTDRVIAIRLRLPYFRVYLLAGPRTKGPSVPGPRNQVQRPSAVAKAEIHKWRAAGMRDRRIAARLGLSHRELLRMAGLRGKDPCVPVMPPVPENNDRDGRTEYIYIRCTPEVRRKIHDLVRDVCKKSPIVHTISDVFERFVLDGISAEFPEEKVLFRSQEYKHDSSKRGGRTGRLSIRCKPEIKDSIEKKTALCAQKGLPRPTITDLVECLILEEWDRSRANPGQTTR